MHIRIASWALGTCIMLLVSQAFAQDNTTQEAQSKVDSQPAQTSAEQERRREAVEQLRGLNESLVIKLEKRESLRAELKQSSDDMKPVLEADIQALNGEIELLEKTFEQVAIGGVDLSVFGSQEKAFDWREELVVIIQPLIENIKSLTEKPRKIEALRRTIEDRSARVATSENALDSIAAKLEEAEQKGVRTKLAEILQEWEDKRDDLTRQIQLAQFQLESLEGKNVHWFDTVRESMQGFLTGRGLTLLLVVVTWLVVWGFMAGVLWLIRKRSSDSKDRSSKVQYRLAAYGYRALTLILVAIAVMTVLYMRQDLLLLAIVAIILVGLALAFKNLLPSYIAEGRLLLNIGAVRERERVMFNGIPWRVSSINMYSQFVNPHIRGSLRVPISELHDLISRPTSAKDWFPSSEGDWVLDDDENLMQVITQGVEMVELRDLDRMAHLMPTADYYAAGYRNISAGEIFRVSVRFGIDYEHQGLDTQEVCEKFEQGIRANFESAPFSDDVSDVRVEFDEAADSSLNYVMFALIHTESARHHNRAKRRIQAACVGVCNAEGWGIPFPQLTVHQSVGND